MSKSFSDVSSEMNEDEDHRLDPDNPEETVNSAPGMGVLLRGEREKKALNYSQISEITRVRPNILKALEDEDWDVLPSSVFVRGFIRSYARALGLEEGMVLDLYQYSAPAGDIRPRPLASPEKRKKKYVVSILLSLAMLITASVVYLWNEYSDMEEAPPRPETPDLIADKAPAPKMTPEVQKDAEQDRNFAARGEPAPGSPDRSVHEVPKAEEEEDRKNVLAEEKPPPLPEKAPETETTWSTLKAKVRERTWIRILVDKEQPKEYIFRPGSQPEWRAKEGFELVIGNAGGIDLEFNGTQIENLGNPGQVVRLRLPAR
jgi:cytoskeleton protein RodZ